ncbi:hypothetical protein [Hwanghaeella sp. LZ110]|uniref:hypothetical protein n=1 Tax=Hwanghaeella sp. LZ110 TaxID=3402810 RepID=UPI003B66B661
MLGTEVAIQTLCERLNWPVRFARWQSARQIAALFSSSQRKQVEEIWLNWLGARKFESEVVAGLSVLFAIEPDSLPPADAVLNSILKPSILADHIVHFLYERSLENWHDAHSGSAPFGYIPDDYFESHKTQVVPPILGNELERLQRETGLPFSEQWAFEWQSLMNQTSSIYSSFPYYFVDSAHNRQGIACQVSQSQCNVFRSAFLRTLAHATSEWGMPKENAKVLASFCLPISKDLISLTPVIRPQWLGDLPERCSEPDAPIESLVRELIKPNAGTNGMRAVSLRIPLRKDVAEYGELVVESFFASDDFVPNTKFSNHRPLSLLRPKSDFSAVEGTLFVQEPEDIFIPGDRGSCISMCSDVWPQHLGFWQFDYGHLGFSFPTAFVCGKPIESKLVEDRIEFLSSEGTLGHWKTWNDDWTVAYPKGGRTRCGGLTELSNQVIEEASGRLGMELFWRVKLILWDKQSDYEPQTRTARSILFSEAP